MKKERFGKLIMIGRNGFLLSMMGLVMASCGGQQAEVPAEESPVKEQVYSDYSELDKAPEYSGGMEALMAYLGDQIQYPSELKEAGIEGKTFISFVVGKDGTVDNVEIKKGFHELADKEAMRVVSEMPPWKPGIKGDKQVAVQYILPVQFQLN